MHMRKPRPVVLMTAVGAVAAAFVLAACASTSLTRRPRPGRREAAGRYLTGGNPLGAAVALASLQVFDDEATEIADQLVGGAT
mgnify:CR=1 FL=1